MRKLSEHCWQHVDGYPSTLDAIKICCLCRCFPFLTTSNIVFDVFSLVFTLLIEILPYASSFWVIELKEYRDWNLTIWWNDQNDWAHYDTICCHDIFSYFFISFAIILDFIFCLFYRYILSRWKLPYLKKSKTVCS